MLGPNSGRAQHVSTAIGSLDNAVTTESDQPPARNGYGPRLNIFELAAGHVLARGAMARQRLQLDFGRQDHHAASRHVEEFSRLGAAPLQKSECTRLYTGKPRTWAGSNQVPAEEER
jgi:hypothetical protein